MAPAFVRDVLLSFCPDAVRNVFRPESSLRTLRAATWTGLLQFLLVGYLASRDYISFFAGRARLLAPHAAGASQPVQTATAILITFEFLIHPLSVLLLYLALEGFVRFVAGVAMSEIVPSLPVAAAFGLSRAVKRSREDRRNSLLPPDAVEMLPGGRIRIASAKPKPTWTASMTIGIGGQWYEVAAQEQGAGQRRFIYILRRTPVTKILRGYEEYDVPSATGRDRNVDPSLETES